MTIADYLLVMKRVRVAELKARLSEYLRMVRRGEPVTVLDRDTPIARIVPYDAPEPPPLEIRPPARRNARLQDVPLPPPLNIDIDVLKLLEQERGDR